LIIYDLAEIDSLIAAVPMYNDQMGHGAVVSSVIVTADNVFCLIGVFPDAEIYSIRVSDAYGGHQSLSMMPSFAKMQEPRLSI
jgi:hypothetical protein